MTTGSGEYRLSRIGLAAGRQLGDKAALGIRVNYHQLRVSGYGSATGVTADAGLLLHLSDQLHFAFQLINPAGVDINEALYTPAVYTAGVGYEQSDQVYVSAELKKEQSQQLNGVIGLQYKFSSSLFVRISVQTSEPSFLFGAGFTKGRFRFDVYSSYDLRLGSGSGIQLIWLYGNADVDKKVL